MNLSERSVQFGRVGPVTSSRTAPRASRRTKYVLPDSDEIRPRQPSCNSWGDVHWKMKLPLTQKPDKTGLAPWAKSHCSIQLSLRGFTVSAASGPYSDVST